MAIAPTPGPEQDPPQPTPPPFPNPKPVREPEPDRLPDETPVPNPDEHDNPPRHARQDGQRMRSNRAALRTPTREDRQARVPVAACRV